MIIDNRKGNFAFLTVIGGHFMTLIDMEHVHVHFEFKKYR